MVIEEKHVENIEKLLVLKDELNARAVIWF